MTALARAQRLNHLWRMAVLVGALLHAMASLVLMLPEADFRAYLAWCESLLAPTAIPVETSDRVLAEADSN